MGRMFGVEGTAWAKAQRKGKAWLGRGASDR